MEDNTTRRGDQLFSEERAGLIARVREGMTVQDAAGDTLGQVERIKIGDPDAATPRGNVQRPVDPVDAFVDSVVGTEPDVPEPKRSQLLRYGYIKIDGSGLTDADRYVRADHVRSVSGDTVTLGVSRAQLVAEA